MSLIPCCDLYADHRPCRCAAEAVPYRATQSFKVNNVVEIKEGTIVKINRAVGALFVPGRGPFGRIPSIMGAVTVGWLVPADEGTSAADKRWARPETTGRYDLIDDDWLDDD